jgi:hypothetical protein
MPTMMGTARGLGLNNWDEDLCFTSGNSLGKAPALIKQVSPFSLPLLLCLFLKFQQICMLPQARTFFKSSCVQVGIKPLELILWIHTRWASLYKFVDRLLRLRKVSRHSPLVFVFLCLTKSRASTNSFFSPVLVRRFLHYQRIAHTPTSSSQRRIGIACLLSMKF